MLYYFGAEINEGYTVLAKPGGYSRKGVEIIQIKSCGKIQRGHNTRDMHETGVHLFLPQVWNEQKDL
jgi:hypothetical protein